MDLAARWLEFLFPSLCPGCDRRCERPGFCPGCRSDLLRDASARCPGCGRELQSGGPHVCGACIDRPPPFARLIACSGYARTQPHAPLSRAIRRLKYDRDVSYARPLAELLAERLAADFAYDAVVPVPLHLSRLRWRGFNQAVLIAAPLARRSGCPLQRSALERVRATQPQVGLDEANRRSNVAGAFRLRSGWTPRGRRILLVDDVFTTGATVRECAALLKKAGARSVDVGVLARAE